MQSIEINTDWWQGKSHIDIKHLCKIERSIIQSMFSSKELFHTITQKLNIVDFTFIVHKKIFEYLVSYANQVEFFGIEDEKIDIAKNLYLSENIDMHSTLKILDAKPSENIALDIIEIIDFSKYRQSIFEQISQIGQSFSNIKIEDEYGNYAAVYHNGVIEDIDTTYVFHLPEELCDTFEQTFKNITSYVEKENFNVSMEINEDDLEDIRAFALTKNIEKIEKIEKLIEWANSCNIDIVKLPRTRGKLLECMPLLEFDNCNISYIPDELFELKKHFVIYIFFGNNQIEAIPKNISNLKQCHGAIFCNNHIGSLPDELFQMEQLRNLQLHNNRLTEIPSKIEDLRDLDSLSISNNNIKKLPSTIANLKNLKNIHIENTGIEEDSLEYLVFENLEKISFDDRLMPYFIKNSYRLKNIDTINLTHSEYKKDDRMIKSLGLVYDDSSWMEDRDYQGHGCVRLSKKTNKVSDGK